MAKTRIPQSPDWKDGFLFVGNQIALDFLNTRPLQDGVFVELVSDFESLLRWFAAAQLLNLRQVKKLQEVWGRSGRAARTVETIRELREHLRKDMIAWEAGSSVRHSTVAELNQLMADHPMLIRLTENGGNPVAELWFDPQQPEVLIAPLAYHAAMLFSRVDRSRVRMCGNCVLHFYDTSKKGTRRWCSMRLCGNRLKVAAYADRQRRHSKE